MNRNLKDIQTWNVGGTLENLESGEPRGTRPGEPLGASDVASPLVSSKNPFSHA